MTRRAALLIVAAAAQLADLVTVRAGELNPIGSSPLGWVAKGLLIVALWAGWSFLGPRWSPVLAFALAMGALGTWSNLAV